MKVTFVYPRAPYYYDRTPYLPLGIAYLAASIRNWVDDIDCIDGQVLSDESYECAVSTVRSDAVCISATLLQMKEACRVANIVKNRSPSSQIIIGGYGPHSLAPEELFRMGSFDIFVRGEGELTLRRVLDCLKRGGNLKRVSNIVFLHKGKLISTKFNRMSPEIDSLPLPARELFDIQRYLEIWRQNTNMASLHMITSRGCPFDCVFCDKSVTGKTHRCSEPKVVVDEMQQLWECYHPDDLFLFDDLFTLQQDRVLMICQEIRRRRLSFKWSAQGKVGLTNLEMLSAMREAGCTELFFGVESGSNRILSFLRKGFTREEVIKTFAACHEVGLRAGVYLIVGVPGEREEDIDLTIHLIERIKPSLLNFSFLTPFPNTRLYRETSQWIDQSDWTKWDDFTRTVYNYPFEVNPVVSRKRIIDAYKRLIEDGLDYSIYQLRE